MKNFFALCTVAFFISCSSDSGPGVVTPGGDGGGGETDCTEGQVKADYSFARKVNAALGKGINLGNGFDASCPVANNGENGTEPTGGWDNCWSNPIKDEYFTLIRAAGFESVRLPVRWNSRAADASPYTINPAFMARVKEVVDQAIEAGFPVILNVHHYDELINATDLAKERAKFVGLWQQISDAFKDYSNEMLVFELLNEPRGKVTATILNEMADEVWPIIREKNPGRVIMINPSPWGHLTSMGPVKVPNNDGLVILTGHYYFPHEFTHQGQPGNTATGVSWGTDAERKKIITDVEGTADKLACRFPDVEDGKSVPINIGEFGTTSHNKPNENPPKVTPEASRIAYHQALVQSMNKKNMSWHYWCLTGCSFDLYDKNSSTWNQAVLNSLMGSD